MEFYVAFFPTPNARRTYELCAVNGLHGGIIEESDEGTRIAMGKHNIEDNNNSPAFAGRLGFNPSPSGELGVSWHVGQYNKSRLEDLDMDDSRNAKLFAIDGEIAHGRYQLMGEYARASIDLPAGLSGSVLQMLRTGSMFREATDSGAASWRTCPNHPSSL